MDNMETVHCFNKLRESMLNCYTPEELGIVSPRNIKKTIDSWATEHTDKKRVFDLTLDWLTPYRTHGTDDDLTPDEKHDLLILTLSHAQDQLKSILTKRDSKQETADLQYLQSLTEKEQTEYLNNMPKKARGEDLGKCNIEKYQEDMEWILSIVLPSSQNKETRFLNLLKSMGYNFVDELNGYPYLFFFLSEILWYGFIICREITPYKEELISFKRYKHNPTDEVWIKRLNYHIQIGERNRHRHSATINSEKWAIPFNDFAKLYRKILGLTRDSLTSPIK